MAPERKRQLYEAGVLIALFGILVQFIIGAVKFGHRDAQIDKKLDREEYYRDIGQMKADLRVLRCRVAKDCE